MYVSVAQAGHAPHDVNVPFRASDPPLEVDVPPNVALGFRIGDQVTGADIAARGDDTLQRFEDAAVAYLSSHASDYPGFAGLQSVHWVVRVSGPDG